MIDMRPAVLNQGINVDDTGFPLMIVSWEPHVTDAHFAAYLERLTATTMRALRERRRVAFVMDARRAPPTPASQRRMMGEWMKANDADTRATCAGFAFVMDSAIQRGLLTAILWIHPLPAPHFIVSQVGDALTWCREQLAMSEPVGWATAR